MSVPLRFGSSESAPPRVVVMGASGFIGRAVAIRFASEGWNVQAVVRPTARNLPQHPAIRIAVRDPIEADLESVLAGCAAVVNCIGRAHVLRSEKTEVADRRFDAVNRGLAKAVAEAAKRSHVRRFVHISSVAAIASSALTGTQLDNPSELGPNAPYGRSKLAGDKEVLALADDSFRPIVLRPPAVYGPNPPGWFALLNRMARLGLPLPIGAIENRRSFVSIANLADAVHASALSDVVGAFVVTDGEAISTKHLYRLLLAAHGHSNRIVTVPRAITDAGARILLGHRSESLIGDAEFDGQPFRTAIGWSPPQTLEQGLRSLARSN